jgi:GDP/UDP-N,N'-diacetylbacillosamine 2-epimerase (hydrolysing)
MKKKICIVTGSRAEYGLFMPLLEAILKETSLQLQLAVTGMHLSSLYGSTYREILKDGFTIDARVRIPLGDDSPEGVTRSVGVGIIGFSSAFKTLKPDMVVLLGDRFETYAVAVAAFLARIPIAHLHGGELTEGAVDDAFRHSITKMSWLHFTSTDIYRRRVIQLGEDPARVFNVGALGIDNIRRLSLLSRDQLAREMKFDLQAPVALVTFHPVTLEHNTACGQFDQILRALDARKELRIVFTRPNCDIHGKDLIVQIERFVKSHRDRAIVFPSLGSLKYLSLLKHAEILLGNSSSGIIERPSFGRPTIDIGDRQKGRIKAGSVISCGPQQAALERALGLALSPSFKAKCNGVRNPYDGGAAAVKIVRVLKSVLRTKIDIKKKFHDVGPA